MRVFNVLGDHAGGLWAEGNREIVHLKGGAVSSDFELEGLQSFQSMSEAPDGSLWVVRAGNAVDAPLCHVTERAVKCFGRSDGIPISPLDSILTDGKGGFWLGGQTALVHWHDGVSETYPIEALRSNVGQHGIVSLALGSDGSVWVGILAEGPGLGLGQLKEGAVKPFVTPTFDGSKVEVFATIFDRDGNLWVATEGKGLFRIHGNVVDHYGRTDGLSSDAVRVLFEDREGILWAATTNGLDSFRDPRVTTFSVSEGLGKDAATGVLASKDGTIWVANDGSLDHIVNGAVSSIRTGSGLPGHQVSSLLEDRAGNLWVGVDDGLYLFKNGRFRRLPEPNHQPLGLVVGITEDVDGNIWAECLSNPPKLVRIRDFQVQEEFPGSQIPVGHTLAADPQGGIWIGTLKGDLALFRQGALQVFPLHPKGNPLSRRIIAHADGSVLAASDDGWVGLRQGKMQRMTTENGLPCNSVISFIEDKEKRWWLYTGCGVVELPDSELQRWWSNPKAVVHNLVYDQLDGAQPNSPFFNSAAYSQDGRVWFASGVFLQMVDPSRLSQRALPAMTYIESVFVDRKEFPVTEKLKLAPHPRDLQIDYTSPALMIPQKVKFHYRLDGYDRDWHDAGTRRQAFYTDLPPGKYSFRVIACNSDGVWSDRPARLHFSVAPAYYQTNWFRALCAAIFLALLWVAYQFRVRQLEAQEKKFREAVETMPALAFVALPDGYRTFVNRRWVEYTGMTVEQASGSGWQAAIHPDDLERVISEWQKSAAAGEPLEYETRLRHGADGEYRWFQTRATPLRDKRGKLVKWCGVATDIEDRKRAEQLQAELAHSNRVSMLGELAASIAHEVKQPLAGVVSNASAGLRWLAGDMPNLEEAREGLRRVVRDGKRAGEVIDRIRALTKTAATPREKLDVNETIQDVVALVGDEAKKKSVIIRTRFADNLAPISGDRVQLQQVLLNLIMNAMEAMSSVGDRARELVISTQNIEADQVQVTVEDSGTGLDPDTMDKIFNPFFTTKPSGMGMGLSISRSILQAHGGRLWATAKDGLGTIFTFTLPTYHEEGSDAGVAAV